MRDEKNGYSAGHSTAAKRRGWNQLRDERKRDEMARKGKLIEWRPGEREALVQRALIEGRITKCQTADVTNRPVFGFGESSFEGGKI